VRSDKEKSKKKNAGLDEENGFWLSIIPQFAVAGEKRRNNNNGVNPHKRV
jgi:hypothetical protein